MPMVTEARAVHWEKALAPRAVTLLPMVTEVRALHCSKAPSPTTLTLLGMATEVRAWQYRKASQPIVVTLLGMTTEVNSTPLPGCVTHDSKAETAIAVEPFGMVTTPLPSIGQLPETPTATSARRSPAL